MPNRTPPAHYIHGTAPAEQDRLSLLNDLLNADCLRQLNLQGGERILDVGSGLGQFTRTMARAAGPDGHVVDIEYDAAQRATAQRIAAEAGEADLVDWRTGDARALPLAEAEWGTFDVVHTRFVLEHVPNPGAVVRQMMQAARPGGRLVLADDDHAQFRLWPEPPGFMALWQAYMRSYDRLGNDPFVGRRLVGLLHEAGAVPRRNTNVFFGSCAGDPNFPAFLENLMGVVNGARNLIVDQALFDPFFFDTVMDALRAWGLRPDAALWYGVNWAEGRKPKPTP